MRGSGPKSAVSGSRSRSTPKSEAAPRTTSLAGLAGVPPAITLYLTTPSVAWRSLLKQSPSIYRKESSRVGEADPAMRGNHPGSLSYVGGARHVGGPLMEGIGLLRLPRRWSRRSLARGRPVSERDVPPRDAID